VFDEATSALDSETEAQIHNEWQRVLKGRTAIVITHRQSAVMLCDRVVTLENRWCQKKQKGEEAHV